MAKLTTGQAAKAAGRAKSSIIRAIRSGRLSAERHDDRYQVDSAEIERVFGPLRAPEHAPDDLPVLPRNAPERPGAAPERDLLLDTMRDTIKRLEADGDRLRGDLADKSRDVAAWQVRYDKLFETHSRLMLTGPTMKAATEDHDGNGTGNEYAPPKLRPRHDTSPSNPPDGDAMLWFLHGIRDWWRERRYL